MLVEIRSPWENCYSEFFDGRLRHELLDREIVYTRQKAQILIEWWRQRYNGAAAQCAGLPAPSARDAGISHCGTALDSQPSIPVLAFGVGLH